MKREGFDPAEHSIIDDKGHSVDENQGYAKKEAVEKLEEADKYAKLHNLLYRPDDLKGTDILHEEALEINEKRDETLDRIEHGESPKLNDIEKSDRAVVLAAVKANGEMLNQASEELKNDKEIVTAAIKNQPTAFLYAGEEMKDNDEIAYLAIKMTGENLKYASRRLRNDKKYVLEAISNTEMAFCFERISDGLKGDIDVVIAGLEKNYENRNHVATWLLKEVEKMKRHQKSI